MEPRPSRLVVALPLLTSLGFGAFAAVPQVRANAVLLDTFLITAGLLIAWSLVLAIVFLSRGRQPLLSVSLLKQHYLQACAHSSILIYWGWYWRPVYQHAYLIAAQLLFAYAFDMLLQLSRHKKYTLGFGPFPIIFSINLFLWFKDDWFYDQFLLIAVGLAAKEFLRWNKGGKWVHIFNPSSFPLALASWLLLFTHHFNITFGEQIAGTQFRPPYIYAFIFLVSLPGQILFGVASMTLPAVVTMYLWGHVYFAATGTYFQYQGYIAIAVFLAMHLLITDPSTSPRTELGRILYGVLYALTVIVLELTVHPGFPAKLMLVPVLNLLVQVIDRAVQSRALRRFDPARIAPQITGRRRNLGYVLIWASVFGVLTSLGGIGDNFPGQEIPFWEAACKASPDRACTRLRIALNLGCQRESGWACNHLGVLKTSKEEIPGSHGIHRDGDATGLFSRACKLRFPAGCDNLDRVKRGEETADALPAAADYRILLSLYKLARRTALDPMTPAQVYATACRRGWAMACDQQPGPTEPTSAPSTHPSAMPAEE